MRALCPELNAAILELAPRHIVRDIVPETFPQIMVAPGIVWSGGSDATIYGDATVNWAFRAWHDATSGRYSHKYTMQLDASCSDSGEPAGANVEDALLEVLRGLADWLYASLEAEYNYQNADEQVEENIRINEYDFLKDGTRA